jgi:hypothetical protein
MLNLAFMQQKLPCHTMNNSGELEGNLQGENVI